MDGPIEPGKADAAALLRGTFHDDFQTYHVVASSADAPDSFKAVTGERDDIVLVISGLNSGDLKATWGPPWRGYRADWKLWFEEEAFRLFYKDVRLGEQRGANRVHRIDPNPRTNRADLSAGQGRAARRPVGGRFAIESAPASVRFCDG